MYSGLLLARRAAARLAIAVSCFACLAAPALAEDAPPLFSPAATRDAPVAAKRQLAQRAVQRVKMVNANLSLLDYNSASAASVLSIEAFDGKTLLVDRDRIEKRGPSDFTWYGTVRDYPKSRAILTVVNGYMAGSIFLLDQALQAHGIFEIVPAENGMLALQEMQQSSYQVEEPEHRQAPQITKLLKAGDDPATDATGIIDVMVVYSNQTAAAAGAGIGAQIQTAIDNTNQIYANSGISQRLRLVHYEQVAYDEHGGDVFGTALNELTRTSDGILDNIHTLRNTYGADLVSMMIENGQYCGIAWIGPSASYGFSVVNRGCAISNSTFAHELGHNMGAMHDPYQVQVGGEGSGPFTYGYGYVNLSGRFRTVMAYDSQCNASGFSCTRIPYMSNPNLTFNGFPTGTPQNDPAQTSDVARVLNTTVTTVANFRQAVAACSFAVSPTSSSPGAGGTTGSLTVTAGTGCSWSATANASWLSVTSGANGSGNGTVGFAVAANTGPARSSSFTVAGQGVAVNQASGCSYSLGATTSTVGAGGGAGSVTITTPAGCTWTASSNASWIAITSGSSGTGPATISYVAAPNSAAPRSGTMTLAGQVYTLNEGGATPAPFPSTSSIDFGEQNPGAVSWPRGVTVSNIGAGTLSVSSITVGGTNPSSFAQTGTCSVGTNLGTGQSCTLNVSFTSPGTAGSSSASLSVGTSNGTVSVALSGTTVPFSMIVHYYQSILHRAPYGGTQWWGSQVSMLQGLGLGAKEIDSDVAQIFFAGSEYAGLATSNGQFVSDVYRAFLNRLPESAAVSAWTSSLAAGMSRDQVVLAVKYSAEADAFVSGVVGGGGSRGEASQVLDYYVGFLNRLPDGAGFSYWTNQLQNAQCATSPAAAVLASMNTISSQFVGGVEYAAANPSNPVFISDMYYAFFRRPPDSGGLSYWLSLMAQGRTREQVRQGFMASPEIAARAGAIAAQGCVH